MDSFCFFFFCFPSFLSFAIDFSSSPYLSPPPNLRRPPSSLSSSFVTAPLPHPLPPQLPQLFSASTPHHYTSSSSLPPPPPPPQPRQASRSRSRRSPPPRSRSTQPIRAHRPRPPAPKNA
ncbi:uncharacterized protein K452DRAFT_288586 [Aplosporella prunicola CBS 121167]|uniref:REJ domain-containing protein n=1 Tax=Aplosporella prunicola CBS 121167 TaxID=1176127 RepID=A0A6A6BC57_9PEZI|nr:uncharacterized protein K452DRAFT_288586 [Aplosporella prunicola CBS 121167]KAF2140497.1 hypothetical protein K452DRAFT_288586 [Aplosporella prunicola CBS 121167]